MRVPYFRGVFMRNTLSTSGARRNESDIMNLDATMRRGTHWIAYAKRNYRVYFDSFGNLRSPKELVRYFGKRNRVFSTLTIIIIGVIIIVTTHYINASSATLEYSATIEYNRTSYQTYDQSFCGQMCL